MRNFISNTLLIISCFLVNGGYAGATVTDCTGVPDYSQSCSPSNGSCDTGTCVQDECYCFTSYNEICKNSKGGTCQYVAQGQITAGKCYNRSYCSM